MAMATATDDSERILGPLSGRPIPPANSASVLLWGRSPRSCLTRRLWSLVMVCFTRASLDMK